MKRILAACVLLLVGNWAAAQVNGQGGVYINGVLQGGGSGAGTVTSVGVTLPAFMNVSGTNPITTSGTFLFGLANVSAGAVFAGPASGADAEPDFRALLGTDLPIGLAFTDPTTDAAPSSTLLKSANAWPGAATNTTGANTILAGGIGKRTFTIVDYSHGSMAGSTVTIHADSPALGPWDGSLTEGIDWFATTSNGATAITLAAVIDSELAGYLSAAASGSTVRITPDVGTYSVIITKTAADAGMTATSGTDGVVKAGNTGGLTDIAGLRFDGSQYAGYWIVYPATFPGTNPGPLVQIYKGAINSYGPSWSWHNSAGDLVQIGGDAGGSGSYIHGIRLSDNSRIAWHYPNDLAIERKAAGVARFSNGGDGSVGANVVASTEITAVGTAAANGYIRTGVYKRAWTNAEVTAFGAVLSGDLKVATLPAKSIVRNAYLVIDSQASGTTTLTVSLGRASTAYIDYIVASNAMVAANTVYGDATTTERGTNLTGWDLPSYTAAVDVYVQFVATDASKKLADVLTCTGTIFLLTENLP